MNRNLPRAERRFTNDYADDGKAIRLRARTESGHRCVRCQHPFESGKHGKSEWSPCDEQCKHRGPFAWMHRKTGVLRHATDSFLDCANFTARTLFKSYHTQAERLVAQWRILTVHHLDGDKANDAWWNLLPLCQRCHLVIQGKVDPRIPWFLEHSEWFKPFVSGFYAKKYEGRDITREEAEKRRHELLKYEMA